MAQPTPEMAQKLIARHAALKAERGPWDAFWEELGRYVMPRKSDIMGKASTPGTAREQVLFDSTAVRSNNILANGQLAWMTPHERRWFSFDAPMELKGNDAVEQWFKRCTEIAHLEIARTNFYSEIHELYLDRGAFGTALIFCDTGKRNALRFEAWPVGSYSVAEDDEGIVDTVSREYELTLRQAQQHFGEENLSEEMRKKLSEAQSDPKKLDAKSTFIHMIFPRDPEEIDPTKIDPENMPFASIYIDQKAKKIVKVSGFMELPFFVTRFLKWGREAYGWSPSWIAVPEARQLNFLVKNMDSLAELSAFPRILVPHNYAGDIDTRAGGVSYFDPAMPQAKPEEWATQGRYDIGLDRENRKQKAIEDAFHVDLFQMFAQTDKQMTATEVAERSAEKLIQFSPTFARMTTELYNPMLQRVFSILLRAGAFPPPPEGALLMDESGAFLPEPKISYSSRIAMSIRALDNNSFDRMTGRLMPMVEFRPDILDNFNFDRIIRETARNDGVPTDWIADEETVQQLRQARAEAQAQQAQMEQAQMAADAAGKMGNIKPESAVGRALGEAM